MIFNPYTYRFPVRVTTFARLRPVPVRDSRDNLMIFNPYAYRVPACGATCRHNTVILWVINYELSYIKSSLDHILTLVAVLVFDRIWITRFQFHCDGFFYFPQRKSPRYRMACDPIITRGLSEIPFIKINKWGQMRSNSILTGLQTPAWPSQQIRRIDKFQPVAKTYL